MSKYLLIAGHGPKKKGFDSGAAGFPGGEYSYMKNKLFPAMKKYANNDFIFHDSYNVYDRGNIVSLAKSYGPNTKVIEFHYDASSSPSAKGGHVIIHSDYSPDIMDLRIRDVIKDLIGIRYSHKGHQGISGRNNLANINRSKVGSVNYRLLELGFGTNKADSDVLLYKTDELAKKLIEAITGVAIIDKNKEEIMIDNIPKWQRDGFEKLIKSNIIQTPEAWENKLDKPITVGEVMAIIANLI